MKFPKIHKIFIYVYIIYMKRRITQIIYINYKNIKLLIPVISHPTKHLNKNSKKIRTIIKTSIPLIYNTMKHKWSRTVLVQNPEVKVPSYELPRKLWLY